MKKSFIKLASLAAGVIFLGQGCLGATAPASGTPTQPQAAGTQSDIPDMGRIVEYVEGGFSPNEIQVAPGTKVTFVNRTNQPLQVASDPHPTHGNLPGFDSGKTIAQGEAYVYTFAEIGSWDFHNHMSPGMKGKVIVK